MKKMLFGLLAGISVIALASCGKKSSSNSGKTIEKDGVSYKEVQALYSTGTTSGEYNLCDDVQDASILHCWNWSYNTIKANLKDIAKAGYSAIQTSPVQQSKSAAKAGAWNSEWYKLYQPVNFAIALDSYLGTKEELAAMCAEAETYGIKVIVDVVANHMGNGQSGNAGSYAEAIQTYSPDFWTNRTTYFHQNLGNVADTNAETVTQYQLSNLPDLNTSNENVQKAVSDYLKELIDAGVDGFRFDAAKHIETPDDGKWASNFWPAVLDSATEYAESKNQKMYYYGEILNTCGGGRKYSSYTKYMSVTDNNYSTKIRTSTNGTADGKFLGYVMDYKVETNGLKSVVWAESHDTYANSDGETKNTAQDLLNRVYAVEMSHQAAAGLYFARPASDTGMGEMGTKAWKSPEIQAVNKFHNEHLKEKEVMSVQNAIYMNERLDDAAMIVSLANISSAKDITLKVQKLKDGTYYDQVSGNQFTVSKGTLTGKMSACGIVVLETREAQILPKVTINRETGYFYETYKVKVTLKETTSASYTINDGEAVALQNGDNTIIVSSTSGDATLKVTAENQNGVVEGTYTYHKVEKREGYSAIGGLKSVGQVDYYAWVWTTSGSNATSSWQNVIIDETNNVAYVDSSKGKYYLIIAVPKGTDMSSIIGTNQSKIGTKSVWDDLKVGQTGDLQMSDTDIPTSTV